jgi:hypothetical protein
LQAAKAKTTQTVGNQRYANHPPHLTIYLAHFDEPLLLKPLIERLALQCQPLSLDLVGWHVFYDDVLAGGHTLVCKMSDASRQHCRRLQTDVLQMLAPRRNQPSTRKRYESREQHLSAQRREAITQFGFPFVGADWQPHFTIACVSPSAWPQVWPSLESEPIVGEFISSGLTLYALESEHPMPLLTCPFAEFRPQAAARKLE